MKELLHHIAQGYILSRDEARTTMQQIAQGKYNDVQLAAFLIALIIRGIKTDELLGLRDGLIDTATPVDLSPYKVIDIVGTGGDGKNTFNISTCACLVVAGAGYKVAKHGNYAATSVSGASHVIQQHGIAFNNNQQQIYRSLEECNFTYLHAPLFAQGMKRVAPVRGQLGIPTCFNMLGPLVNPCRPAYQLLGVARLDQMRMYSSLYEKLGTAYTIVNSIDGYDEISLTGAFKVKSTHMEKIFTPADLGLPACTAADLYGGDTPEQAAQIFDDILNNRSTPQRTNAVIANAAFAIKTIEPQLSIQECLERARVSLQSGRALGCLNRFIQINKA